MKVNIYKIDYGSGLAFLYTPHEDWESRFYTLAGQCFGIRKSILKTELLSTTVVRCRKGMRNLPTAVQMKMIYFAM
jgi:hypothetical protein